MDTKNDYKGGLNFRQIPANLVRMVITRKDYTLEEKWMTIDELEAKILALDKKNGKDIL